MTFSPNFLSYIITFLLAALFALLLTPAAIKVSGRLGIMDHPGDRRIHSRPIPRLGGAAIYISFWLAVFISSTVNHVGLVNNDVLGLFLGSTIIFFVGIYDDIKGMRPLYKLLWQILSALVLLFYGFTGFIVESLNLSIFGVVYLGIFGYVFSVLWIVGLVNTVNISDGLDGLAAGICFIASLILFWSANRIEQYPASFLMLALAGVALGFLFYNYHPARVFMGDSGSMFFGYIIGAVSIMGLLKTATVLGLVFPLLVLGLPIMDMIFAIIRRRWKGLSIARADRGHLHHRLLDAGLSQREAVFVLYFISFCFGLAGILCAYGSWFLAAVLVLVNLAFIIRIFFRKFRLYHKNQGK